MLATIAAAYQQQASRELLYLAAIVLSRSMRRWAREGERCGVLPSHLLLRLEDGLAKSKKYLGLWVTRYLSRARAKWLLLQEAEALWYAEADTDIYPSPSDPLRLRAIERALAQLTPVNREIITLLGRNYSAGEIASARGTTRASAQNAIERARKAFGEALQKNLSPKRK